jgi:hypothetical protein
LQLVARNELTIKAMVINRNRLRCIFILIIDVCQM